MRIARRPVRAIEAPYQPHAQGGGTRQTGRPREARGRDKLVLLGESEKSIRVKRKIVHVYRDARGTGKLVKIKFASSWNKYVCNFKIFTYQLQLLWIPIIGK